jgi:hypothetical protein
MNRKTIRLNDNFIDCRYDRIEKLPPLSDLLLCAIPGLTPIFLAMRVAIKYQCQVYVLKNESLSQAEKSLLDVPREKRSQELLDNVRTDLLNVDFLVFTHADYTNYAEFVHFLQDWSNQRKEINLYFDLDADFMHNIREYKKEVADGDLFVWN